MGNRSGALLACAFAVALCAVPQMAWAADHNGIDVNGVDIVADEDHRVECGDGFAKYDPDTGVLTLTDAEITKTTGAATTGRGISSGLNMDLKIVLVGNSTVNAPVVADSGDNADPEFGTAGNIVISGEGSLTITSEQMAPNALNAWNGITIDGAKVIVRTKGWSAINSQYGGVNIINGAHVEASSEGGDVVCAAQVTTRNDQTNVVVSGTGTYLKAENPAMTAQGVPAIYAANDVEVKDGATVEVSGMVFSATGFSVQSGASLAVSNEDGMCAIRSGSEEMAISDATVKAHCGASYGINAINDLAISNSTVTVDAQNTAIYSDAADVSINGGTTTLTAEQGYALHVAGAAQLLGGTQIFEGASGAMSVGSLSFGDQNWYQWVIAGDCTKSWDEPYDPARRSDTYLRIEPADTKYQLTVTGGTGGGSYAAGQEVTIKADAIRPDSHFQNWTMSSPYYGAGIVDETSAETTFTMPAASVTLTANYEPHSLSHNKGFSPTCTDPGLQEGWFCICGAWFLDKAGTQLVSYEDLVIPAAGHAWKVQNWTWTTDGSEATANFVCSACRDQESVQAQITSEVIENPSCADRGSTLYTATAELDGDVYTDACELRDIPAIGHDLEHIAAIEPTCTQAGTREHWKCARCGELFLDEEGAESATEEELIAPVLDHDPEIVGEKDETCTEPGYTGDLVCARCDELLEQGEEVPAAGHAWGAWKVTVEPSCEADGTEERVCSTCAEVESRPISALGHAPETAGEKEPTCTEEGYTGDEVCSRCDEVLAKGETVAALGHAWGDWVVVEEPGCAEEGAEERACQICGEVEPRVVPCLGHDLEQVAAVAPTCTDSGVAEHWVCGRCGELFLDEEGAELATDEDLAVSALGHDASLAGKKDATCTEDGYTGDKVCSRCEELLAKGKAVPATGHAWGDPVWSWSENEAQFIAVFTCENDGEHTETLSVAPDAFVREEPTCTESGLRVYEGSVELDGRAYAATAEETIPPLGHEIKDGVCTRCGEKDPTSVTPEEPKKSDVIPATGDYAPVVAGAVAMAGIAMIAVAGAVVRRRSR